MAWVGRDLKDHLVQPRCHKQGHLPLDQVAQSPVQPGLGMLPGIGSHSFSGQPVPNLKIHQRASSPLCCFWKESRAVRLIIGLGFLFHKYNVLWLPALSSPHYLQQREFAGKRTAAVDLQIWTAAHRFYPLQYSAVKLAQFYKTRAFWTIPVKIIKTSIFFLPSRRWI